MNQLYVYIYPLPLELPSHHPHPTEHRAESTYFYFAFSYEILFFSYIWARQHFDVNIQLMNVQASKMFFENHTVNMSWIIFKVYLFSLL